MTHRHDLLTTQQAAHHIALSPRTLERYRVTGEGPPFLKVGRLVRYRIRDLDVWLDAAVRQSTSDPGPGARRPRPKRDSGSESDSTRQ